VQRNDTARSELVLVGAAIEFEDQLQFAAESGTVNLEESLGRQLAP
jgi:hypothetical protein